MTQQNSKFDSILLIIPIALVLYVIPWVFNPGMTLSLGAYDFAEFLAKRPFDDPSYYTIYALRGQLFLLTLLIAFNTKRPYFTAHWWLHVIACLVLIVAQMPPLTFISNTGDTNQQIQAYLTMGSIIGAGIGLSSLFWKQRIWMRLIISIMGIISVIYGLFHALDIMNDYAIPANLGIGGVGLGILYGILCLLSFRLILKAKQTEPLVE